jgi:DNA-binding CsgD family transcriptional regulator
MTVTVNMIMEYQMGIRIRKGNAKDGGFIIEGNIHVSRREIEALVMIAKGYDNEKAAAELGVSYTTFRNHTYNVMKKLGANNRTEALVKAVERDIIEVFSRKNPEAWEEGNYFVCMYCGRAFIWDDVVWVHVEPFEVNHVLIEPPDWPKCPNEKCRGHVADAYSWVYVREHHPEYPETPEKGVEYSINDILEKDYEAILESEREWREGQNSEKFVPLEEEDNDS